MVIDSHAHVMLPTTMQLQSMQEAGVDCTILFATTPHVEQAAAFSLQAIQKEMQALNQLLQGKRSFMEQTTQMKQTIVEVQQAIAVAPERFYGFAPVPLGLSAEKTGQWLEQMVVANGLRGVGEITPGSVLQMEQVEAVLQAADDYKRLPVWIHTFYPVTLQGMMTLMALCRQYPAVPVIFGHLGGVHWMEVIAFAKRQPNVYLDLSAAYAALAVRAALAEVPERCLFSSDAPFGEPSLLRQMIEFLSPSPMVTKMVLGGNVAELLCL